MRREEPIASHGVERSGRASRHTARPRSRMRRPADVARAVRTFGQDACGIAAVEFAFIAPIMLVMLLGAVEITRAVSIDRRLSVVTSMVADLVTRSPSQGSNSNPEPLTADDVNAIYDVIAHAMSPFEAGPLTISIIPVASHPTDASNTVVYPATTNRPSYNGGEAPARCQSYPLPAGLLEANESVVVVEANYTFKPLFAGYLMNGVVWQERAIAKPRGALCVDFGDKCGTCFS